MAALLYRIGHFSYRRKWTVLVAWLLILVAAVGADKAFSGTTSDTFTIPGIEAQQAMDRANADFAGSAGVSGNLVFQAPSGQKVTAAPYRAAIDHATAEASRVPGVKRAVDPFAGHTIARNGGTAYTSILFDGTSASQVPAAAQQQLASIATEAAHSGLTVAAGGNAAPAKSPTGGGSSTELIGILAALLVLTIAFRSLVAAFLPLLSAVMAVGIGTSGLMALSGVISMSSTAPALGSMLGLAVGIDYALFIVSRHQNQVRAGMDPRESAARAVGTSGSAVLFAGATVVIALSALAVVDIPFLTVMGLGAAGTVVVAVLLAVTLLPAFLGFLGPRIGRSRLFRCPAPRPESGRTLGARWAAGVTSRLRWPAAVAVVGALLVLAAPSLTMQLGMPQNQQGSAAQAATMISDGFGSGYNGPLSILVTGSDPQQVKAAARQESAQLTGESDVARVSPARFSPSGEAALLSVIPGSGPDEQATTDLVNHIRADRGTVQDATGTSIAVTGQTAINIDLSAKLAGALPVYMAAVVVLAMLLLLLVFRSLAVPLKAMLGFLLSALAALGATIAAFQWGWLADAFGVPSGQLLSILPTMLLGILFGLAMDYEVFLVSRMREEYVHGAPPGEAIRSGFAHSARVVTAAALIMIAVFASFVASNQQMIKPMAFSFAVGVFCDAFLVRMTLVPALLAVLGRSAWWLPRPLARLIPKVDIEGAALETRHRAPEAGRQTEPEHRVLTH